MTAHMWLAGLMKDLDQRHHLESLTLELHDHQKDKGWNMKECQYLPELQLGSLRSLKRMELLGFMPIVTVSLPSECLLRLKVACSKADVLEAVVGTDEGRSLPLKLEIRK